MAKIRVRLKAHRNIYIHNDIGNVAFYFKNRVDQRIANGDRDGVGLEIIAGLTFLAFEVEARFNFLGAKLITDWNERVPAMEKVEQIYSHLGVTPDFPVRPYSNIRKLKNFRDTLAHGKPEDRYFDQEVEATPEELEAMGILHAEWEDYIDHGFFQEAYDDVEKIWKELLAKSGLTVFDTLTHGGSQTSFIEHVQDAV
jgi:antitoxin component HigA of HigAB toxin-antitoxin module